MARRCWSGAKRSMTGCAILASSSPRRSRSITAAPILASKNGGDSVRRVQRQGYLYREVERMVNQDRHTFGALLLKLGEADVMVTGTTRPYTQTMRRISRVIDPAPGVTPFGVSPAGRAHAHDLHGRTPTVTERPSCRAAGRHGGAHRGVARAWGTSRGLASCPIPTSETRRAISGEYRGAVALLDTRTDCGLRI
jgi:malate dehydrogenase (oxaloacetate-decarboxylating)(NADP+)